jgi:hypothetical protein
MAFREVPLFDQVDHWKEFAIPIDLSDDDDDTARSGTHAIIVHLHT